MAFPYCALRVVRVSASALLYQSAPDHDVAAQERSATNVLTNIDSRALPMHASSSKHGAANTTKNDRGKKLDGLTPVAYARQLVEEADKVIPWMLNPRATQGGVTSLNEYFGFSTEKVDSLINGDSLSG